MKRQTLVLFIGTIVLFFMLIGAAIITIMVMPPELAEDDIELNKHFDNKKEEVLHSIKDIKFANVMDYIKDVKNPVPDVNRALSENRHVLFPKGMPFLDGKISIPSDTIVQFESGAKIFGVFPEVTPPGEHCVFSLHDVKNVTIIGNGATVYTFEQGSPEEGFPTLCMLGAKEVFVMDLGIVEAMGYGIKIAETTSVGNAPSENVELFNVTVSSAKKGGILIESVKELKAYKITVEKSQGKLPENGITIASSDSNDALVGIELQDVTTTENNGIGFEIRPGVNLSSKFTMILKGYQSTDDGEFAPIYLRNSPKDGKVTLKSLNLKHREGISSLIRTWDTKNCEIDVFKPTLNGDKNFDHVVTDQKADPFPSNLDNLNIKK